MKIRIRTCSEEEIVVYKHLCKKDVICLILGLPLECNDYNLVEAVENLKFKEEIKCT